MLKSVEMHNYRAFRHLVMDNLPRVCLLSGKNSVGKSTVLEGILFFYRSHTDEMLIQSQITRPKPLSPHDFLSSFFHDFEKKNDVIFKFSDDKDTFTHVYQWGEKDRVNSEIGDIPLPRAMLPAVTRFNQPITGVSEMREQRPASSLVIRKQTSRSPYSPDKSSPAGKEKLAQLFNFEDFPLFASKLIGDRSDPDKTVLFLTVFQDRSGMSQDTIEALFSRLQDERREGEAIDLIKKIAPRIADIRLSLKNNQPILMCGIEGMSHDVPLSHMGDGTTRSFAMMMQTLTSRAEILLIDEIENGIHYSVLQNLWEALFANAIQNRCQIFATTHSYECIAAAISAHDNIETLNPASAQEDLFAYYRLERHTDGEFRAVRYGPHELVEVMDSEWEIR